MQLSQPLLQVLSETIRQQAQQLLRQSPAAAAAAGAAPQHPPQPPLLGSLLVPGALQHRSEPPQSLSPLLRALSDSAALQRAQCEEDMRQAVSVPMPYGLQQQLQRPSQGAEQLQQSSQGLETLPLPLPLTAASLPELASRLVELVKHKQPRPPPPPPGGGSLRFDEQGSWTFK